MRDGVTMVDPASTYIDADVGPIGQDIWIGPGVCAARQDDASASACASTPAAC